MRLSDYRYVLTCALVYGLAVVLARFAFEDGSNAATVVSVRCAFAALAIGIALRIGGPKRHTTGRERALLLGLGLAFALGVFSFYRAIEILRVPVQESCCYSPLFNWDCTPASRPSLRSLWC